jgi:hypothetical protein
MRELKGTVPFPEGGLSPFLMPHKNLEGRRRFAIKDSER